MGMRREGGGQGEGVLCRVGDIFAMIMQYLGRSVRLEAHSRPTTEDVPAVRTHLYKSV